ncbi:Aspartate--tRNA ligase, cytoplasmic [Tritrichomonas foetus]|uniref:aspartate--tRNA ligase n=1 Tax=Tritrichomonas foetus TaxID=1144522 RepID=A0A1J4JFQ0_9EUKA|nr:Aspartate--tRNA ligase, cytoplasmic [Tritrichomonas foetus]|eukprot:OHS97944.1 Aspartate--tRNA ligase, cytoplasmic [Tritrichomonas foetus]
MSEEQTSKLYGDMPLIQSQDQTSRKIYSVSEINSELVDKDIYVRAFASVVRGKGKVSFLLLRSQISTIQACCFVPKEDPNGEILNMVKYIRSTPVESLVEVYGTLVKVDRPVTSATIQDMEIQIKECHVVSKAQPTPIVVADCARVTEDDDEGNQPVDKSRPTVTQKARLDNRVLDLRTIANQAIFKIQSRIGQYFREYLLDHDFQEIHTPKLISTASEGGAEVFKVAYFDGVAYLAQSPQLYKQMAVVSGMPRVFEIGPVFRAENSFTHRHLTEFTGLDAEMSFNENYHEALELFKDLLATVFNRLNTECRKEIEAVRSQFPSTDCVINPVILKFPEAVKLLRDAGMKMDDLQDLSSELEKKLGEIVKEKYNTDFFILDKFPSCARPFYTMPDPEDPNYSNSYDMFLRGEEIVSGAQRIHDSALLLKRAEELKVNLTPIQAYVDCFKYGAPPHAGLGCGLDRMTFLFLGLKNVRRGSMFPRDPMRLNP